ncbi:sigma-70 family RNA polymerase sigma factor [Mucilaginibacter corticis]|uniref:Sigma-70 family RNA polymerase sigma factor n=1 Tax=Mucilaginibacter corticis TaxID=2597670 RepID=A0A556M980_9SPHI|nr:sigma-70 family RNA polymerase sigma factor [Mucilaginibacter corticis]TSJ36421.1 sigma-70 family RNA polymerase sigma factor [Mucilaginibacter corticis]
MPLKSLDNEKDLLMKIAKGDQKAFAVLFEGYHNPLGEYIMTFSVPAEMAEEVILDIFVKIWMNRIELIRIENFSSYLFILTRNHTLNAIRKTVNNRKKQDSYLRHLANEDLYAAIGTADHEKDYTEIVEKAVAQLPPQQQKVFILKREGKKNGDIAMELDISSESVRKYYQWAVKSVSGYVKSHIEAGIILAYIAIYLK